MKGRFDMATKNAGKTKSAAASKAKTPTQTRPAPAAEEVTAENAAPIKAKALSLTDIVTVRNGYQGKLVYISKKTGEKFVWGEFGDEQDMDLGELKSAKSASKKYFENNWFILDDPAVIEFLGLTQYYQHTLGIDGFDDIFTKSAAEVKKIVSELSNGQRRSVAYRARQLISEGKIDSRSVIAALEEALNTELIEQ